jgi:hypothetical protein
MTCRGHVLVTTSSHFDHGIDFAHDLPTVTPDILLTPAGLEKHQQALVETLDTRLVAEQLGRTPTLPEVAARLNASEEAVGEALAAAQASHNIASLDAAPPATDLAGNNGNASLQERLGRLDSALEVCHQYTRCHSRPPSVAVLPKRCCTGSTNRRLSLAVTPTCALWPGKPSASRRSH